MRLSTILKITAVAAIILGVILSALVSLVPFLAIRREAISATPFIIGFFSLAALACATTLEQGRLIPLMWSGIVSASIAALGWFVAVVAEPAMQRYEELWLNTMLPFNSWTILCAIVGLLMQRRMPNAVGMHLRRVTLVIVSVLAAIFPLAVWLDMPPELSRFQAILAVLGVFGIIATLLVSRLRQLTGDDESRDVIRMALVVTCPRCELRQDMVTGGDTCNRCGLQIRVMVP